MKKLLWLAVAATLLLPIPGAIANGVFDHQIHVEDNEMGCAECHSQDAGGMPHVALMPTVATCVDCHDEEEIESALIEVPSSHAGDYEHQHQFDARGNGNDCVLCHAESDNCTLCHHGEGVDYLAHDRNWFYTHSVAARKGITNCVSCHDTETYCNDCHQAFGIAPGDHFVSGWSSGSKHGEAAIRDLGSCVLCHDGPEPLCKACHN